MTRTPLTRDNVLARLASYILSTGAAPTAKELASENGWGQQDTADQLFSLAREGRVARNMQTKRYRPVDGVAVSVTREVPAEESSTVAPPTLPPPAPQQRREHIPSRRGPSRTRAKAAQPVQEPPAAPGQGVGAPTPAEKPTKRQQRSRTVLVLLDGEATRQVALGLGETKPKRGDEWAENVVMDGRRRYRIWFCYEALKLESGTDVRLMIPVAGVTLKPEEVA